MLYQSANCEDDDDDQFPFLVLHTQYDHELWVVTRSQDKHMILCPRPKMILSEWPGGNIAFTSKNCPVKSSITNLEILILLLQ